MYVSVIKFNLEVGIMLYFQFLRYVLFISMSIVASNIYAVEKKTAPQAWAASDVPAIVSDNILYLPIAHEAVKSIGIQEIDEPLIDLSQVNNARIKPLSFFSEKYVNSYAEYSKIRQGVYLKLLKMLEILPENVGIAYFEGYRPLSKQKEYFDKKFKEILAQVKDKELAYQETSKLLSPFINNVPTHATGAAIDIALFEINDSKPQLIDMGKFDVIFGPNDQQETFSENISISQKMNRLMMLLAAAKAGLVNYGYEWWHYSFGDKAWAYVKKQKQALYGLATNKNDPILSLNKETYLKSFD